MMEVAVAGIVDPGVVEIYCDGSVQIVDEDVVHSTLYVNRGEERVAVARVHMSRRKHADNVRRIFKMVCGCCTARHLQMLFAAFGIG